LIQPIWELFLMTALSFVPQKSLDQQDSEPQKGHHWLLQAPVTPGSAPELLARLLAANPTWDFYLTDLGLAMEYDAPFSKDPPVPLSAAAPDLVVIRRILSQLNRSRLSSTKVTLTWQPQGAKKKSPADRLGPWKLSVAAEPLSQETPEQDPHRILIPHPLYLSPRFIAWHQLAMSATKEYLTPPPGAPETKGGQTLILDESPAIISTAALLAGSSQVVAVCFDDFQEAQTKSIAHLNGTSDRLSLVKLPPPPWPKGVISDWKERFNLAVINLSPYLILKILPTLVSALADDSSRLILTGLHSGAQTSTVIKAAARSGLTLLSSSTTGSWSVLGLIKRRPSDLPQWEWNPGDLMVELSEDEKDALAEAEKADKGRSAKSYPMVTDNEELQEQEPPETREPEPAKDGLEVS
jgi:hypothetical protein